MKRKIASALVALTLTLLCGITLTSCDDDSGWYPVPPNGWTNAFYDSRLTGSWELVQVNDYPVDRGSTNYLTFFGNGRGWYYYYYRGEFCREQMAYWCQDIFGPNGNLELNLQYENGQASTMDYWFSNGASNLWMKWNTSQGTITYRYRAINDIPW